MLKIRHPAGSEVQTSEVLMDATSYVRSTQIAGGDPAGEKCRFSSLGSADRIPVLETKLCSDSGMMLRRGKCTHAS